MKKLIIVLAVSMVAVDTIAQIGDKPTTTETRVTITKNKFRYAASPNEKGYAIVVESTEEGQPIILVSKNGLTQKIKMNVWNAKPDYFENKYGKLPMPPPPPPAPPVPPVPPVAPPAPPLPPAPPTKE